MAKTTLPILAIKQFQNDPGKESFYANLFSQHLKYNHTTITTPHKHDFYLSACFTQGHGTHTIDFKSYPISPGALFFLHPGQTHSWELSDDIEGYIFFHSRAFYDSQFARKSITDFPLFHSSQFSPFIPLSPKQTQNVIANFQSILAEYPLSSSAKAEKVCSLLDIFYIDVSEELVTSQTELNQSSNTYLNKIKQLEQLIEASYKQDKLPNNYAIKMHMTAKHLNRICKHVLGKTTSQLISTRVMLEAKRMLVHPENELSKTAFELGFKDYAYFSRWFKNQTGQTPSEFKKEYY
jgi:AraC-like DNA-binding protein